MLPHGQILAHTSTTHPAAPPLPIQSFTSKPPLLPNPPRFTPHLFKDSSHPYIFNPSPAPSDAGIKVHLSLPGDHGVTDGVDIDVGVVATDGAAVYTIVGVEWFRLLCSAEDEEGEEVGESGS